MAIQEPVSFWNFDESSGNAADAKASNTLTNNGTTPYVTGLIGNAISTTSASSQGFSISNASQVGLGVTSDFSISVWINPTTLSDNQIMGKYGAGGQRSWRLEQNSDGGSTFYFTVDSDGSSGTQVSWAGGLSTATWYHIVLTWKASTSKANLYINGTAQAEKTTTGVTSMINGSSAFCVGEDAGTGNFSNCKYDMAGFWNVVLAQTDVDGLYNSGAGIQYPFAPPTPPTLLTDITLLGYTIDV